MSGDDTFIARWSRLKQQVAEEKKNSRTGTEAESRQILRAADERAEGAEARSGHAPAKPVEAEPPFDVTSLPSIESIVADTDIRAFLQKGVPPTLTRAALRRAWTADPAIRDFIEMAENQWDFTDPTSIPGFGPLQATDNVRQLVEQALGNLPGAPEAPDAPPAAPDAGAPECSPDAIAQAEATAEAPPVEVRAGASAVRRQLSGLPEASDNLDTPPVAALQQPEPEPQAVDGPRRKGHGRAMPR
jgi:Protein of unknown function (DUF3306)